MDHHLTLLREKFRRGSILGGKKVTEGGRDPGPWKRRMEMLYVPELDFLPVSSLPWQNPAQLFLMPEPLETLASPGHLREIETYWSQNPLGFE